MWITPSSKLAATRIFGCPQVCGQPCPAAVLNWGQAGSKDTRCGQTRSCPGITPSFVPKRPSDRAFVGVWHGIAVPRNGRCRSEQADQVRWCEWLRVALPLDVGWRSEGEFRTLLLFLIS